MKQKKLITIIVLAATLILAGIAGFTAFNLWQLGKKEEKPGVYQEQPYPGPSCDGQTEFTVSTQGTSTRIVVYGEPAYTNVEIRVTDTSGTVTPYQDPDMESQTPGRNWIWTINTALDVISRVDFYIDVTGLGQGGIACGTWANTVGPMAEDDICQLSFTVGVIPSPLPSPVPSPSPSPIPSPVPSPSPSPSPTPIVYVTPSPTPPPVVVYVTPSPTPPPKFVTVVPSPVPTPSPVIVEVPVEQLPSAGTSLPTIILALGGILLVVLGFVL